jgi:hypothetical protein
METSLFAVLLLTAFVSRDRPRVWPIIAALATLARPEGGILVIALLVTRPRRAFESGIVYLLALAQWCIYATLVYGSVIPHSVTAKAADVYYIANPTETALGFLGSAFSLATPAIPAVSAVILLSPLTLRRHMVPIALWLFPLLFVAVHTYAAARGGFEFPWYVVPLLPWAILIVSAGITEAVRLLRNLPGATLALGLLVMVSQVGHWNAGKVPATPFTWHVWDNREALYITAVRDALAAVPAGRTVAAPEIGAIGWAAPQLRILDTVGLVSPEALRYYPLPTIAAYGPSNAVPAALLRAERPDYVLSLEVFLGPVLRDDPSALDGYFLERSWPTNLWGSHGLLLYRRQEQPGG